MLHHLSLLQHLIRSIGFSAAFRKVSRPRPGRWINGQAAVVFHPRYELFLFGLEFLQPFDTHKYGRIYFELVNRQTIKPGDVFVPQAINDELLSLVHSDLMIESLSDRKAVAMYLESPIVEKLSQRMLESLVETFRFAAGGTVLAAEQALYCGLAINLGGGFHHAKPRYGEGFCLIADIPIAIKHLKRQGHIQRVLIVDLDVHQGNGTVVSLIDEPDTFTFSMHQGDIYPTPKETSTLDIELEAETQDEEYLNLLSKHLPEMLEQTQPHLVFYVAGCDTLREDPLASIEMSPQGVLKRDQYVVEQCRQRSIPLVMTLAGGYSRDAWKVQLESIHAILSTFAPHPA